MEDQEEQEHEHFCDGCGERMEADFYASVQEEKERRHAQDLEDFLQFAADWLAMVAATASSVEEVKALLARTTCKEMVFKYREEPRWDPSGIAVGDLGVSRHRWDLSRIAALAENGRDD